MQVAISIDLDTTDTLKLTNDEKLSEKQLITGLRNFLDLADKYNIKATLFVVGYDLYKQKFRELIKEAFRKRHEIASHTMYHPQNFLSLSYGQKREEIRTADDMIYDAIKERPAGFRAPGWNISDEALTLLKEEGYLYDSSVFPSYFNFALKICNYFANLSRPAPERVCLSPLINSFKPTEPYASHILEIPLSVTPVLRLPFFGTSVHFLGKRFFDFELRRLSNSADFINFEFHLADFHIFDNIGFNRGIYAPHTLDAGNKKLALADHILLQFSKFNCRTLSDFARRYLQHS